MPGTIQVTGVRFYDEPDPDGEAGYVHYLVLLPDKGADFGCTTHPDQAHWHEGQPFCIGGWRTRAGATEESIKQNRANLWGWNGVKDAATITLEPSLGLFPHAGRPFNAHLFLTNGQIRLCGDATVTVHPNPQPCRFPDEQAPAP